MKRIAIVVIVAAGVLAWYLHHRHQGAPHAAAPAGPAPAAGASSAPRHVVELAAGERREIAAKIAAAQAARASGGGGGGAWRAPDRPSLPAADPDPQMVTTLREAMREAIPVLTECYEQALPALPDPSLDVVASLTLTGDPDIGTLIDADQLFDQHGQPLPAALDACLRARFQTLELPALAEGDKITVRYPFAFRSN